MVELDMECKEQEGGVSSGTRLADLIIIYNGAMYPAD